jgi:LPXTG-motif cell wall-anchored protein
VALLVPALAPSGARAATPASYRQVLRQIRTGPVIRAIINRPRGDIEIKFRDLSEWESSYPRSAQPMLQRLLHRRHIRVLFAARPRSSTVHRAAAHHHLRYIAAAVLGLLLIGAGGYVLSRRRRRSGGARAGAERTP